MIDTHAHIIYGIDDGAKSLEESIEIIKKMHDAGYKKIVATPHYVENTKYISNNEKKLALLDTLKSKLEEENIDVELYLGNEVFINNNLVELINNNEIMPINNKNYLLVEIPMNIRDINDVDILSELNYKGKKVLLAHPERYLHLMMEPDLIEKYIDAGILLQGNIYSLTGLYGKKVKKLFIKYLKERKYFCLASDIHHQDSNYYKVLPKLIKKAIKLTDEEYINKLMSINPQKMIDGE